MFRFPYSFLDEKNPVPTSPMSDFAQYASEKNIVLDPDFKGSSLAVGHSCTPHPHSPRNQPMTLTLPNQ